MRSYGKWAAIAKEGQRRRKKSLLLSHHFLFFALFLYNIKLSIRIYTEPKKSDERQKATDSSNRSNKNTESTRSNSNNIWEVVCVCVHGVEWVCIMPIVCTRNLFSTLSRICAYRYRCSFFHLRFLAFTLILIRTDLVSFAIDICIWTNLFPYFTSIVLPFLQHAHEMECDVMTLVMVKLEIPFTIFFSPSLLFFLGYSNVIKSNAQTSNHWVCVCVCAFYTKIECHSTIARLWCACQFLIKAICSEACWK